MPHLIFQTKFPMHEEMAEISIFGSIEKETMEALQQCTLAALQSAAHMAAPPVGFWRPSPYSGHVVHFAVNMPGSWQWRCTLQNVLRVAWMDVFERAGWSVVSMWNCSACASTPSLLDLALVGPPPPAPRPPAPLPPHSPDVRHPTLRSARPSAHMAGPSPNATVAGSVSRESMCAPTPLPRTPHHQAPRASTPGGAPSNGLHVPPPPPPAPHEKEAARSASADDEAEKEELAISALTAVAQSEHFAAASSSPAHGACSGGDVVDGTAAVPPSLMISSLPFPPLPPSPSLPPPRSYTHTPKTQIHATN